MLNPDQILEAIKDLSFCAECHRELEPEDFNPCYACRELTCRKCSKCACDRVAATV